MSARSGRTPRLPARPFCPLSNSFPPFGQSRLSAPIEATTDEISYGRNTSTPAFRLASTAAIAVRLGVATRIVLTGDKVQRLHRPGLFRPLKRSRTSRARKRSRPVRGPRGSAPRLHLRSYRTPNDACQTDRRRSDGICRLTAHVLMRRQGGLTSVRCGLEKDLGVQRQQRTWISGLYRGGRQWCRAKDLDLGRHGPAVPRSYFDNVKRLQYSLCY